LFAVAFIVAACGPQQTSGSGTTSQAEPPPATRPAASPAATTHPSGGICHQAGTEAVCQWPDHANGSQL